MYEAPRVASGVRGGLAGTAEAEHPAAVGQDQRAIGLFHVDVEVDVRILEFNLGDSAGLTGFLESNSAAKEWRATTGTAVQDSMHAATNPPNTLRFIICLRGRHISHLLNGKDEVATARRQ